VFIALAETVTALDIPIEPFRDLLIAFRQDQKVHRYENWGGVLDYCRFSANPVGRLVLYLTGYRDAERQALSDATCTALQLANFWQDVDRDLEKNRIYIPLDLLHEKGLTVEDLFARNFDDRYVKVMQALIARTRTLFAAGAPLAGRVSPSIRVDIELFSRGGLAVLDRIESMGYNTLQHRPAISRATQIGLLGRALLDRCFTWILPSAPPDNPDAGPSGNIGGAANGAPSGGNEDAGQSHSTHAGRHA
jgi:squalene synthase HpnC